MALSVEIAETEVRFLNDAAKSELLGSLASFRADLIQEANRLEATAHTGKGDPEVTSSMVRDANLLLRRGYVKKRRHPLIFVAQLGALAGGYLTGFFTDLEKLKDPRQFLVFVVVLIITITSGVIVISRE